MSGEKITMGALISRERLLKDLKELVAAWGKHPVMEKQMRGLEVAIEYVQEIPSEVVYCKDCKYYGRRDTRRFYRGMDCLEKRIDTIVPDRDFCSKGEKDDWTRNQSG